MKEGKYDCLSENTVEQLMFLVITVIRPHRWSGVSGVLNCLGLEMRETKTVPQDQDQDQDTNPQDQDQDQDSKNTVSRLSRDETVSRDFPSL
jgi:hypothetical protein